MFSQVIAENKETHSVDLIFYDKILLFHGYKCICNWYGFVPNYQVICVYIDHVFQKILPQGLPKYLSQSTNYV